MDEPRADPTSALLDRIAIEDCLARYCHAVDRGDLDLLRAVYWPDSRDNRIEGRGGAAFAEFCAPIFSKRDQMHHITSNLLVRIEGDEARAQSYFHAFERVRRRDRPPNDIIIIGRYLDILQKRAAEWRILDRTCVIDSWRIWPDSADWDRGIFGSTIAVGRRDENDPAQQLFGDRLRHDPAD